MKKVIKNKIFLIVLLCIISCGIGVYAATTYKANEVVYNASDGTSMNVNDALNELYDAKKNIVEESKKNPDVISSIVSSLYNGEKKTYTIAGKSINCASFSGTSKCTDSFTFDSNKINIYETPDGKTAVLNSIALTVGNSNSHSSYSYENSASNSAYSIIMEDGSTLLSGSTINNTLSLFNYAIGTNKYLNIKASASIMTQGAPPQSVGAYASASIGTITLTYIIMK